MNTIRPRDISAFLLGCCCVMLLSSYRQAALLLAAKPAAELPPPCAQDNRTERTRLGNFPRLLHQTGVSNRINKVYVPFVISWIRNYAGWRRMAI